MEKKGRGVIKWLGMGLGIAIISAGFLVWSADQVKEKGLVGYWNFDEGKGTVVKDSSGNGNNGEIAGAEWVKGKVGNALEFNGEAYVEIPHSKGFDLTQLTIEMWIKTPEEFEIASGWRCLFSKEAGGAVEGRDYNFYTYSDDGIKVTQLHFSSAVFGATMFPLPAPYEPKTWHHVAITVDANGNHIYYSDGKKFAEAQGTPGEASGDYPVLIGKADNFWNGVIDEVRLYNRALSPDEINAHYKAALK